ncbi:FecR family protein [Marinoscillum sp. MHG1-6]|uniref:FecR family protein n=1 Tax=Marinoscillum sp. MHG1-6 TaxID=2959627 RepID=UPI002157A24A|nr:FecR domain-containing protein [Marinoscillum sp. MHG1-6]
MDQEPKHITEEQWARYFAGESTDQETNQIESWRDASSNNADLFLEYSLLWEDFGTIGNKELTEVSVDMGTAWEKIKGQKEMIETEITVSFPWFKIAASILVVMGLFFAIRQLNHAPKDLFVQTQNNTEFLQLSDGSEILLNRNSSLEYPEEFSNERKVKLTGEGFFDVSHDPDKQFLITIGEATITVLGTAFNIKSSELADTVSVLVSRGKVLFAFKDKEQILTPGQKATLFTSTQQIIMQNSDPSGLDEFWRTHRLQFNGQSLRYVVKALTRAYNKNILLSKPELSNCSLSAIFENDSLSNILDVIALTLNLEVKREGSTITLSGDGCEPN